MTNTTQQAAFNKLYSVRQYMFWLGQNEAATELLDKKVEDFHASSDVIRYSPAHEYSDKWSGIAHHVSYERIQEFNQVFDKWVR